MQLPKWLRAPWPLLAGPMMALSFVLAGCGGSGSDSNMNAQPASSGCVDAAGCSAVYIAMTDADGDFLSYTVDVVSL